MSEWTTVGKVEEIPPGFAARVEVDETPVAIFNVGGELCAIDDTCSHAEASLSQGELDIERGTIECPLHGSTFDVHTGEALTLPAVEPVRVHHIDTSDNLIKVALNDD